MGRETGCEYHCIIFIFFPSVFVFSWLTCSVTLFRRMMAVVSVSLFSLSLVPLTRSYWCWCIEVVVSVMTNYLKSQVFDHHSVDFLGIGSVLNSITF